MRYAKHLSPPPRSIRVEQTFVSVIPGDRTWAVFADDEYIGGVIDHYGYASSGAVHPTGSTYDFKASVPGTYQYRSAPTLEAAVAQVLIWDGLVLTEPDPEQ